MVSFAQAPAPSFGQPEEDDQAVARLQVALERRVTEARQRAAAEIDAARQRYAQEQSQYQTQLMQYEAGLSDENARAGQEAEQVNRYLVNPNVGFGGVLPPIPGSNGGFAPPSAPAVPRGVPVQYYAAGGPVARQETDTGGGTRFKVVQYQDGRWYVVDAQTNQAVQGLPFYPDQGAAMSAAASLNTTPMYGPPAPDTSPVPTPAPRASGMTGNEQDLKPAPQAAAPAAPAATPAPAPAPRAAAPVAAPTPAPAPTPTAAAPAPSAPARTPGLPGGAKPEGRPAGTLTGSVVQPARTGEAFGQSIIAGLGPPAPSGPYQGGVDPDPPQGPHFFDPQTRRWLPYTPTYNTAAETTAPPATPTEPGPPAATPPAPAGESAEMQAARAARAAQLKKEQEDAERGANFTRDIRESGWAGQMRTARLAHGGPMGKMPMAPNMDMPEEEDEEGMGMGSMDPMAARANAIVGEGEDPAGPGYRPEIRIKREAFDLGLVEMVDGGPMATELEQRDFIIPLAPRLAKEIEPLVQPMAGVPAEKEGEHYRAGGRKMARGGAMMNMPMAPGSGGMRGRRPHPAGRGKKG